jgi:hypothetical protein
MNLQLLAAMLGVVITIYFALLVLGFLFKLLFIASALVIGAWASRSWRDQR